MAKFSERYGHVPVRSVLQTDGMDDGMRNRLWNLIRSTFFSRVPHHDNVPRNYLPDELDAYALFKSLFHDYFKQATDTIPISYIKAVGLKKYFIGCVWYQTYDLLEFLAEYRPSELIRQRFIESVNKVLKEELSGYRFVSGRIAQITSDEEIAAIEQALALPDSLKPVREHLNQSLTLLSDRKQPDYRNSIKESISEVESLSKIAKLSLNKARRLSALL